MDVAVLWRRIDQPGHECARLSTTPSSCEVAGTALFAHDGQPCRLDYRVVCDTAWRTRRATVSGWVGRRTIEVTIEVDGRGWRLNGAPCPAVGGAVDIDLNFSPSTNVLPIRRLGLAVGQHAAVRAAWLRFPEFTLEPLDQVYRRTADTRYRYESAGGRFVADLDVDADGLVTRYPPVWEMDATTRSG
jgi:hypothetical protein